MSSRPAGCNTRTRFGQPAKQAILRDILAAFSVTILEFRGGVMLKRIVIGFVASTLFAPAAFAQLSSTAEWAAQAQNRYQVTANVTYLTASGYESKLDIYRRRDATEPQPTLVFYHGGGWILGSKESSFMSLMPWLEMGWNVVNVEYRMVRV